MSQDTDFITAEEADETEMSAKMAQMRQYRTKAKPKKKIDATLSVSKICEHMGYIPAVGLVHVADNNLEALGEKQNVPIHTRTQAMTTLLSYTAPRINNVDFVNNEAAPVKLLNYVPERGSQVQDLIAELDAEAEEEYEYVTDNNATGEEDSHTQEAESDNF